MLRPFAHPVACCCVLLGVVAERLKPVKRLAPCKRSQHCWELLSPFARSFKGDFVHSFFSYFFMQVENHDDFFTTEEGRVHIQDQRGYYIMYDSALADFK